HDFSEDLDAYSQGERGIKEKEWRYRIVDGSWQNTPDNQKPTLNELDTDGEYEIELKVEDFQGAFATHREIVNVVTEMPNSPPVARFIHAFAPYYEFDTITVTSRAYDPDEDPLDITFEIR